MGVTVVVGEGVALGVSVGVAVNGTGVGVHVSVGMAVSDPGVDTGVVAVGAGMVGIGVDTVGISVATSTISVTPGPGWMSSLSLLMPHNDPAIRMKAPIRTTARSNHFRSTAL